MERDRKRLCQERAANQRSAYRLNLVLREPRCQLGDERLQTARLLKQSIEVEPQVPVMTGFKLEVSTPGRQQP
jgi:hypothetical protein